MFKLLISFVVSCGMLLSFSSFGQVHYEAPLESMPMQYNPSFAGQAGSPRINANVNYNRSKSYYAAFQRFGSYVSYDQFIPALRSGIGITAGCTNANYTDGVYFIGANYSRVSSYNSLITVAIAPKISLKGKYTISPSIDFSYGMANINYTLNSAPVVDTMRRWGGKGYGINSRAGLAFNTNKFYIGYSINILKRPVAGSEYNPVNGRPNGVFESYLQAGYTFHRSSESNFSFTPQVVIQLSKYNWETINFMPCKRII